MNYYPHHIGDYLRDTAHLSMLEDAAYRRMLDLYYASERPLPLNLDGLYRLVRAKSKPEREAVDTVLEEYFLRQETGWHNARADQEITQWQSKCSKAKSSADIRWQSERNAKAYAVASQTQCQSDANQNQNQNQKTKPMPPCSGGFLKFWGAWPKSERKESKGKCWELWQGRGFDQVCEAILVHVESLKSSSRWRDGFIPAPLVYLNQRRWEGTDLSEPQRVKVDV